MYFYNNKIMRYYLYHRKIGYVYSRYRGGHAYYNDTNGFTYNKLKRNLCNKIIIKKRGRTITKNLYRKRDLCADPFLP